MKGLPLAGRRVLITRAAHQAGKLSEGLRALGAETVEVPVLEIQPPASYEQLDAALRNLSSYDWLVFTSANSVQALTDRAAALDIPLGSAESTRKQTGLKGHGFSRAERVPKEAQAFAPQGISPKIAAIGEATAVAVRNSGFEVGLVPEKYVAESLVGSLAARCEGKKILLARAEIVRDVIPDALRAAGARVDVVDAYRNVMPQSAPALVSKALKRGIDAATFTSSSSVTHLAEAARAAGIPFPFPGVAAISIGPITSLTLREHGWDPATEANPHDIPGLIAAIAAALRANF